MTYQKLLKIYSKLKPIVNAAIKNYQSNQWKIPNDSSNTTP
jgi:hypothetical protein